MSAGVRFRDCVVMLVMAALVGAGPAQAKEPDTTRGDQMIAAYFAEETAKLQNACLQEIQSELDWKERLPIYRRQLAIMLATAYQDETSDLQPVITGRIEQKSYFVEKVHFQSRPGLYVTGNLYIPKDKQEKHPAVLYLCGHSPFVRGGTSYGNKVSYRHHADWFARNGYVCLIIDTLQLGEVEGTHHGTYGVRKDGTWKHQWWWAAQGYSPAGVEAWNALRAVDYLVSRPEVDAQRIGVTGRSGGGASSWWLVASDERIKCAVPVAGITDLQNHVVDGCIEGHCDCMFPINTYRWDYPQIACLAAPRPLLISNTDRDPIFPLDGVIRTHTQVRRIYRLLRQEENLGLNITAGPHKDTQELRCHAFRWFNEHLKNKNDLITEAAPEPISPSELKVFKEIPEDQINTRIEEVFVSTALRPRPPADADAWKRQRDILLTRLKELTFRGWPEADGPLEIREIFTIDKQGVRLNAYEFTSAGVVRLRLYLAHRSGLTLDALDLIVLNVLDDQGWQETLATFKPTFALQFEEETLPEDGDAKGWQSMRKMLGNFKWGMAYVCPRGVGPTAWTSDERAQTHLRRRFHLLGQTWEGMQVYDTRRAVQAIRQLEGASNVPLWLQGERRMGGVALYASLFEPNIARLDLWNLPKTHRQGPIFLNVLRVLDMPTAVTLAAERSQVRLYQDDQTGWEEPQAVAKKLNWNPKQLQIRQIPQDKNANPNKSPKETFKEKGQDNEKQPDMK